MTRPAGGKAQPQRFDCLATRPATRPATRSGVALGGRESEKYAVLVLACRAGGLYFSLAISPPAPPPFSSPPPLPSHRARHSSLSAHPLAYPLTACSPLTLRQCHSVLLCLP